MAIKDSTITVRFDPRSTRRIDRLTKAVERLADARELENLLTTRKIEEHLYQKIGANWLHRIDICSACTAESQSDNTKEN